MNVPSAPLLRCRLRGTLWRKRRARRLRPGQNGIILDRSQQQRQRRQRQSIVPRAACCAAARHDAGAAAAGAASLSERHAHSHGESPNKQRNHCLTQHPLLIRWLITTPHQPSRLASFLPPLRPARPSAPPDPPPPQPAPPPPPLSPCSQRPSWSLSSEPTWQRGPARPRRSTAGARSTPTRTRPQPAARCSSRGQPPRAAARAACAAPLRDRPSPSKTRAIPSRPSWCFREPSVPSRAPCPRADGQPRQADTSP